MIAADIMHNSRPFVTGALVEDANPMSMVLVDQEWRVGHEHNLAPMFAPQRQGEFLEHAKEILLTLIGQIGIRFIHEEYFMS